MESLGPYLDCLGLTGPRWILRDFFGLFHVPPGETISVRQHMRRVRRPHIVHLNIIRVGFDSLVGPDRESAERELAVVVHRARQIYDQIQLGVARVQHYEISTAEAAGMEDIGSDCEADDLCDRFSVDNNGIDGFFVLTYVGNRIGSSRSPGACDKDGKSSGVVVEILQGDNELTATAYAHEIGHYLGYDDHSDDQSNLLSHSGQRGLTESQGETMRDHCTVTECSDLP